MRFFPYKGRSPDDCTKRYYILRNISQAEIVRPFQLDYHYYLRANLNNNKQFTAPLVQNEDPIPGCKIDTPFLDVVILQRAYPGMFHGPFDVAIIEAKESKAYIVLEGETMKHWLDRGIVGFGLPFENNPGEEVSSIISEWRNYSRSVQTRQEETGQDMRDCFASDMKALKVLPTRTIQILNRTYGKNRRFLLPTVTG